MTRPLRVGRIDYLNVWPIFHQLCRHLCHEPIEYFPGHPNELNRALHEGRLDISPSSSFEYLAGAEAYRLLAGHGICARTEVRSVVFLTPCPIEELGSWMRLHPGPVLLSQASATSSALLRILWQRAWGLESATWQPCPPGLGITQGRPHLEIGNIALQRWVNPPPGWHIVDLAQAWHQLTGLPFVFAVWILREESRALHQSTLMRLASALDSICAELPRHLEELAPVAAHSHDLSCAHVLAYWRTMHTTLGPEEHASLAMFGAYATELGLLRGMPALSWFPGP